ncbi:MAG TPA: sensor domain-containing diguanylate cyclase [Burkholderiales bacterium]|nr:sensor domain-containing diguanylate cyclase [Burkholderiales bacterium]
MSGDRIYDPDSLTGTGASTSTIGFPIPFVHEISRATTMQGILDIVAYWTASMIPADRCSITMGGDDELLKIFALQGNAAIPQDRPLPIEGTMVGRVYRTGKLMICGDLASSAEADCKMLAAGGINSCMDAPLLMFGNPIGTLNVGHRSRDAYDAEHAVRLQCIADWVSLHLHLHLQIDTAQRLASTDQLTGAANRRAFVERAAFHWSQWQRSKLPFVIACLDLDKFKDLNDTYGHNAGDKVLVAFTESVKAHTRDVDLVVRMGGEEFAVIFDRCQTETAVTILERIRRRIELKAVKAGDREIWFTFSAGVAAVEPADKDIDQVMRRADRALYDAKNQGRNRVVVAGN